MSRFSSRCALSFVLGLSLSAELCAQLPVARLNSVFPAGGKLGTSFEVTITGTDLELAGKLLFTHPGITATPKTRDPNPFEQGPQPVPNTFTVKIDAAVPPGWYELRTIGKFGVSNSRAFLVDDLDEGAEKEPNNTRDVATVVQVPSVINGQINGGTDVDYLKFTAKGGQRLTIDCWASRIDSRLEPILTVVDAAGRELAGATNSVYRDAVIDFVVPADGDYYVRLYDAVYGGSVDHFYRVSISAKPYIEYVLPNAGLPGTTGTFTLYGRNLPGGADAGVALDGKPLQKLSVQIAIPGGAEAQKLAGGTLLEPSASSIDGFEYRFKGPTGTSNPMMIGFATAPVVLEQEPNAPAQPQKVAVPCEFVGQSQMRQDKDCIVFEAKAGEVYWLEMVSQRQGASLDPQFSLERVVTDKDGKQTFQPISSQVDDNPTMAQIGGASFSTRCDDPSFSFSVPADGTYRVLIGDLYNRGNPRFVYRLAIRKPAPDFRLSVIAPFPINPQQQVTNMWSALVRRGGSEDLRVYAFRRDGFNENIEVSVEGLPAGVTCPPVTLGPGQNAAPLVLTAAENAAEWAGMIRVVGKATIAGQPAVREARGGTVIWPSLQPGQPPLSRVSRDIALAVTAAETANFQVNVGDGKVLEMYRAGKLEIPVKAVRRNGFAGNLQINPMPPPLHNIQLAALTLAGNAADGKLNVTIPANVPPGTYTFSLLAQTQMQYARNADLAKAAEAEKQRVDKLVTDLAAEAKRLTDELAKVNAAKSTDQAKAAAKKAADDATAKLNAAKAFQQAVTQQATNLANAARPQNINMFATTTSFTIKVAEAPITFAAPQPALAVKQAAAVEATVTLNRLYGYAEQITLELVPPGGVSGVSAAAVNIPNGQAQGKLMIQAAANATPGAHTFQVRATARPGGQALPIGQNLTLTVEAVQAKKQ
jgi:hypothetical protein